MEELPSVVLPNGEDEWSEDDDVENDPTPVTFENRHEHQEAREDIEYEQQL